MLRRDLPSNRRGGPRGAAAAPASSDIDQTDLAHRWRPSRAESCWSDNGVTPATAGGLLYRVDDEIGTDHLLQATALERPTWASNATPSKHNGILFALGKTLSTAGGITTTDTTYYWVGMFVHGTDSTAFARTDTGGGGIASEYVYYATASNGAAADAVTTTRGTTRSIQPAAGVLPTARVAVLALVVDAGSNVNLYVDGVLVSTNASSPGVTALTKKLALNVWEPGFNTYSGPNIFAELALYSVAHDATAVAANSAILKAKYTTLAWAPADATAGAFSFAYDFREAAPLAVGGGAISDGAAVGSLPGRSGSSTLAAASGKELTYWAARRGGRAILQGAPGKWMVAAANPSATDRVMAVAEIRWPEVVRGIVGAPVAFQPTNNTGLWGLDAATVAALGVVGFPSTNRLYKPEDYGGNAISEFRVDGQLRSGLDVASLDRVSQVIEARRAAGWSGAKFVLGDDRNLGAASGQWPGGIVAAYGLTTSANAADVANLRAYLLAYHQGGTTVGFVGDSITAGWGVTPANSFRGLLHADYKATVGCPTVSIPGGTIPALIATDWTAFDAMMTRSACPVMVVHLGTNDIGTAASLVDSGNAATAITNLTTLIAARRAAIGSHLKVVISTLCARKDDGTGSSSNTIAVGFAARKATFDASIRANYVAIGADAYIDFAADATVGDPWAAGGFLTDQVHPDNDGHLAMKVLVKTSVETLAPA